MSRRKPQYKLDKDLNIREEGVNILKDLARIVMYVLATMSCTVVAYILFALVFSTDEERRLQKENRAYRRALPELEERARLVGDVVAELQIEDSRIYSDIFHADAPSSDPLMSMDYLFGADTIPDTRLSSYALDKADRLLERAASVERKLGEALLAAAQNPPVAPVVMPVKDVEPMQIGAGVGIKSNPFLKARVRHDGQDILVQEGTPVLSTADGVVTQVVRTTKGLGNTVVVSHEGGYETRYAPLSAISVRKGQKVSRGARLGSVGTSSNSYVPHLHYEVWRWGEALDPILFSAVPYGPKKFANVLFMAVNTEQSMD